MPEEGDSRGPKKAGCRSRGGILGGAETVEACVRDDIWLIWLIDLFSGRARNVEYTGEAPVCVVSFLALGYDGLKRLDSRYVLESSDPFGVETISAD